MAIPRIGQEVIVSFLEGNPDRPLITGRVNNALNMPPYELPQHKTRTVFKSMSPPGLKYQPRGFNELRVEDQREMKRSLSTRKSYSGPHFPDSNFNQAISSPKAPALPGHRRASDRDGPPHLRGATRPEKAGDCQGPKASRFPAVAVPTY